MNESKINIKRVDNFEKEEGDVILEPAVESSENDKESDEKEALLAMTEEQRIEKFLDKFPWIKDQVIKSRDKGENFAEEKRHGLWSTISKEYYIEDAEKFCANVINLMSEKTFSHLVDYLDKQEERDFSIMLRKLKEKGVSFFDDYAYHFSAEAFYSPDDNRIYLRQDFDKKADYLNKIKHEVIHALVYNLKDEVKKEIDEASEVERLKIWKELEDLIGKDHEKIKYYVADNYKKMNILYVLSNSDEVLAHLTDPEFRRLLEDLEEGKLVKSNFMERLNIFKNKKERYINGLPQILDKLYKYYN